MKQLKEMTSKNLKDIKLIVLDVDGILVPRGTKISKIGNSVKIKIKKIRKKEIELIKRMHEKGFNINISSGRSLQTLKKMFSKILRFVSITYENGSATFFKGKIYHHSKGFSNLEPLEKKLKAIKSKSIEAFEPKQFIITIHCKDRVNAIEKTIRKYGELYCLWNGEAYDIGLKNKQTKAVGLKNLIKILKLKKKNILVLGDNYNDKNLTKEASVSVSADKERMKGQFFIPLSRKNLPASVLLRKILQISRA